MKVASVTPATAARDIQLFHYLRPAPQPQINGMEISDADKTASQNPG